jgi:thiol-disulfide isomerase/thioredoxin
VEIKANNPFIVGGIVLIIIGAIFLLQMTKPGAGVVVNDIPLTTLVKDFPSGKELASIHGYINTKEGFKLEDVKGKVILIDFWTYSCINCIRTLPYITAWDEKYRDKGLVIVGVHTPEFDFEKEKENVQKAVLQHKIKYPVVLDNDYGTWRAYQNRYWPRKYLIDSDGFIRYDHIGEGGYQETERQIQLLLMERDEQLNLGGDTVDVVAEPGAQQLTTPELYFGYNFARHDLGNSEGYQPEQDVQYTLPEQVRANRINLEGTWKNTADYMELVSDTGSVILPYQARSVNIVAGNAGTLTFKLDGRNIHEEEAGTDVLLDSGIASIPIVDQTLYNVINDTGYFEKTLTISAEGKGFRIYTFTFG